MSSEFTTEVGRLVGGHPLEQNAVMDDVTKLPKKNRDGSDRFDTYVGLAVPKGAETHWNQTPWGLLIWQAGAADWPNGEFNAPTFAWKVTDGDSAIPNKKGKKPCEKEGFPGHWIINASQGWPIPSYHCGRYEPHQVIQRKEEIKRGDYCRLKISVKGNGVDSQSPGVYINPSLFELTRAGIEIVSDNAPDANAAFGGAAPVVPTNAQLDPNAVAPAATTAAPAPAATTAAPAPAATTTAPAPAATTPAPPPPAVAPAPDFLEPVDMYTVKGVAYTKEQLLASNWTEAQIAALVG